MNAWSPEVVGFVVIVEESVEASAAQDICVLCDGEWIHLRTKPIFGKKEDSNIMLPE
jgi:hypothetical protein